ncbi:hypothetical protein AK812_SmicGene35141 [Symbiodinium microadriaticum]|uniref:Uncharacterized protein n=1 Tax=Symbiodinium microadriaticum TaxID=2951 RepID=A0A1Q9CM68_SYMMI|nr:hypothetical protein AK812_SmicGene35141 [Symbiodinium microadriaticum]
MVPDGKAALLGTMCITVFAPRNATCLNLARGHAAFAVRAARSCMARCHPERGVAHTGTVVAPLSTPMATTTQHALEPAVGPEGQVGHNRCLSCRWREHAGADDGDGTEPPLGDLLADVRAGDLPCMRLAHAITRPIALEPFFTGSQGAIDAGSAVEGAATTARLQGTMAAATLRPRWPTRRGGTVGRATTWGMCALCMPARCGGPPHRLCCPRGAAGGPCMFCQDQRSVDGKFDCAPKGNPGSRKHHNRSTRIEMRIRDCDPAARGRDHACQVSKIRLVRGKIELTGRQCSLGQGGVRAARKILQLRRSGDQSTSNVRYDCSGGLDVLNTVLVWGLVGRASADSGCRWSFETHLAGDTRGCRSFGLSDWAALDWYEHAVPAGRTSCLAPRVIACCM